MTRPQYQPKSWRARAHRALQRFLATDHGRILADAPCVTQDGLRRRIGEAYEAGYAAGMHDDDRAR